MSLDTYTHTVLPASGDAPLVFAFHGTGGDETQFLDLLKQILPAAKVVAPRGDVSEFGANRFFRRTGEGVYDMEDLGRATAKMTGFVDAHRAAHAGRPVIGLGYSNGANILASVAFERPDLFEGIVLMHPLIPWTPAPTPGLKGRSVLVTGGAQDPIAPAPTTDRLIGYFRDQGSLVEAHMHPGGHDVAQSEIARVAAFLRASAAADAA